MTHSTIADKKPFIMICMFVCKYKYVVGLYHAYTYNISLHTPKKDIIQYNFLFFSFSELIIQNDLFSWWLSSVTGGIPTMMCRPGRLCPIEAISDLNNNYWREAIFIYLLKYINKINFSYQKR